MRNDQSDLVNRFLANKTPELRDQMVLQHVSLVHFVLGRMGISKEIGADYEDMVSQGLLGLIDAVDRYDPNHGAQFSSYAVLRVRGKILDYLRSMDWMSRGSRKRTRLVQQAIVELLEKLHREPTDEEIAEHVSLEVSKVQQALVDSARVVVSMDSVVESEEDDAGTFHELLADENQVNPAEQAVEKELKARLVTALKQLPEREQMVLSLYYYDELTFKEIGEVLGVSESRVCQLHARATISLKAIVARQDNPADGPSAPVSGARMDLPNQSNKLKPLGKGL